jgi:nitronate monooxygenase
MKTRITELLGIKVPIQCGGMLWLAKPELAAAISNTGALGNLTSGNYDSGDEFRQAIHDTRKLTDKPFIVNITTMPSIRLPVELLQEFFRVGCEEKVTAFEIAGAPVDTFLGPDYIPMAKEAGVKVIHKVGTVKHAIHAQKVGYDAVIIAGFEEGGFPHKDNVSTLVLAPKVVESVDIPVVVAGGMADGKSLAAVLSLGADGVMMASRFVATKDCGVHEKIHQMLLDRDERDTSLNLQGILSQFGLQVRALRNKIVEQIEEIEKEGGDFSQLFPLISGQRAKDVWKDGNVDEAMLTFGQSIGRINDIPTVAELIDRMVVEAEESLAGALAKVRQD